MKSALMRPQKKNMKSMRSSVVRNGAIIGMESPNIQITEISAADPTKTSGYKIVNQVRGGIRKKRIPKNNTYTGIIPFCTLKI